MQSRAMAEQMRQRVPQASLQNRVHMNAAGSSIPDVAVVDAQTRWLEQEAVKGGYEAVEESKPLHHVYTSLSRLLNCNTHEVALCESATIAYQRVLYGCELRPSDVVLISSIEYGSNAIALLQLQRKNGFGIELLPELVSGEVDCDRLEQLLAQQHRVALISLCHIPTSSGLVQPVHAIGKLCKQYKVPLLIDATQSVGQLPIDLQSLHCDFLCGTGRKYLRAPRGTGFLYVRSGALTEHKNVIKEPGMLDNYGAEWTSVEEYQPHTESARCFETFEMSIAAHVGLGHAAEIAVDTFGVANTYERIQNLAARLREGLQSLQGVALHDHGNDLCGIVSFTIDGADADHVREQLALSGFQTTVSKVPSTRYDFQRKQVSAVNRVSLHAYNLEEEVDRLIDTVQHIADMS